MARSPDEYTVKFKILDDWHYSTFKAANPEHAARLFWASVEDATDDAGFVNYRTAGGLTQVRASAITGIVVQK